MKPWRAVWLASAWYAIVFSGLAADRYLTYRSGADLGLFTQTIATAFAGFRNTVEGGSHFTFHFSPILYLLAVPLRLAHSALALLVLQACASALVAPPIFLIARKRVSEPLALGIALIPLIYPPLAGIAFSDFHENGLVPAATAWLLWAVDARRFGWAALLLAATLAIKEDQAVILGFASVVGLGYFLRNKERAGIWFSATALLACIVMLAGYFSLVRPLAGAPSGWEPVRFYSGLPPPEHRGLWRGFLERFTYLLEAFAPLCFMSLASPVVILALPGFAELLFAHDPVLFTMGQHYAAVWIPYVLVAFALGIARVYARRPALGLRLVQVSAVLCVLNLIFLSPTHWSHYLGRRTAHEAVLDGVIARLPSDMAVGTHDEIFAHLGFDPNASLGLERSPPYVLLDTTMRDSYWVKQLLPKMQDPSSGYRLEWQRDGIELYKRTLSP